MSRSLQDILEDIIQGNDPTEFDTGGDAQYKSAGEEEIDVAEFVERLGKSASLLSKVAESLPSDPAMVSKQLRLLDNPFVTDRADLHNDHRGFVSQVLPQSMTSETVPRNLDEIQKAAGLGSGESLARKILSM